VILLDYLEQNPEQWIRGKDLAETVGVSKRELRDKVKSLNLSLIQIGARELVVSSNGSPAGYRLTHDPNLIERYRNQQRALATHINDNVIMAEAMLKRLGTEAERPPRKPIEQISMYFNP